MDDHTSMAAANNEYDAVDPSAVCPSSGAKIWRARILSKKKSHIPRQQPHQTGKDIAKSVVLNRLNLRVATVTRGLGTDARFR